MYMYVCMYVLTLLILFFSVFPLYSVFICSIVHGNKLQRTRFDLETVNAPAGCVSEIQFSTCLDGTFSSYTGTYSIETCDVKNKCGTIVNGGEKQRTRFEVASVTAPASCENEETQTSICTDGTWGPWSGSFLYPSCEVGAAPIIYANCGDVVHGESQEQTRYQSASVNAPSNCVSEIQTRYCNDGMFDLYTGSFTISTCVVKSQCGITVNGGIETRQRFETTSANAPSNCVSETQTKLCNDGTFGPWSGSYLELACTVRNQCESVLNGGSETRQKFETQFVNEPASCQVQSQQRTCDDGSFSDWSGIFTYDSCTANSKCER